MNGIIDLGTELLIDQSRVYDSYLRLLVVAVGQRLIRGSAWLVIEKSVARAWCSYAVR